MRKWRPWIIAAVLVALLAVPAVREAAGDFVHGMWTAIKGAGEP